MCGGQKRGELEIVAKGGRIISLAGADVADDIGLGDRLALRDRASLLKRTSDLSESGRLVDDEGDDLGRFQGN